MPKKLLLAAVLVVLVIAALFAGLLTLKGRGAQQVRTEDAITLSSTLPGYFFTPDGLNRDEFQLHAGELGLSLPADVQKLKVLITDKDQGGFFDKGVGDLGSMSMELLNDTLEVKIQITKETLTSFNGEELNNYISGRVFEALFVSVNYPSFSVNSRDEQPYLDFQAKLNEYYGSKKSFVAVSYFRSSNLYNVGKLIAGFIPASEAQASHCSSVTYSTGARQTTRTCVGGPNDGQL